MSDLKCYCRMIQRVIVIPAVLGLAMAPALMHAGEPVRAEMKRDRVSVYVDDNLFTEYIFTEDWKYPYFYPLNGPRTGETVTTRETEPWPHHHSLFFACTM